MMTRLVKILFFAGILLFAACLIAPSFIDWNQHKAEVVGQISPYFQRKIDVAGNVGFKVLPQPEILLENVTVANEAGSLTAPLMTLKSLEARIKLGPLLEGRIEVENINLSGPVLNLAIKADGKTSLSNVMVTGNNTVASSVQLNEVSVTGGTIRYSNELTGTQKTLEDINLSIKADTLRGPYKVKGDLQYQKTKADLTLDMDALGKDMSAPVQITFAPSSNMPHIKLNGVVDLHNGFDITGEVTVSRGKLDSLINIPGLELAFLNEPAELTGTMEAKGDQFIITDVKAKFGKAGLLRGKLSLQYRKGSPLIMADLDSANLTLSDKPSDTYISAPAGYQGGFRLKGKNIIWEGRTLDSADMSATFKDKDWTIKSAQVKLAGLTEIRFAGTVSPKSNSASYTGLQIVTADLPKLASSFAPPETSIFATLATASPIKKLQLNGNAEISPAKISFFNIEALADDKTKISGVFNTDRMAAKPNMAAKVHLANIDSTAFSDTFLQALLKADADLEVTADNYTRGALKVAALAFKGKTDAQGLAIESLSGTFADKEKDAFSLAGRAASLAPLAGVDVTYTLKAPTSETLKALGTELPSTLSGEGIELKGTLKQADGKPILTAQGTAETLTIQGQSIAKTSFSTEQTTAGVKLTGLTGTLWNGQLSGEAVFTQQVQPAPSWSSAFKGNLKAADLKKLQDLLGYKGFKLGPGDITFDLTTADSTLASISGILKAHAASVTLENFSIDKLNETLTSLKAMPEDLQQLVEETLQDGTTTFKDVNGTFKLERGTFNVESLNLINSGLKLPVNGTLTPPGGYDLSGNMQITAPANFPPLKITRSSKDESFTIDAKPLEDYVIKNLPAPPPAALPPEPVTPEKKNQAIGDILNRLEDDATPTPEALPAPKPALPPGQQPDAQKMMQQLQMQDMLMEQNGDMPVPLVPPPQ